MAVFLDESGIFEKKDEPVRLNAGLLYHGDDLEMARAHLQNFLVEICRDNHLTYPKGLHGSEIADRKLRRNIQEKLLVFLAKERVWSVVGIIAGEFDCDKRSNIIDEDKASNLYHNMLIQLLDNILCYTDLTASENQVELHIASRVARVNINDRERQNQYEMLGYDYFSPREGLILYKLIDEPVINAALSQLYQERERIPRVDFQFHVQSIYKSKNNGLMAADLICNWLFGHIYHSSVGESLIKIDMTLHDIGINSYIWAYDRIDGFWRDMMDAASHGDYYRCFGLAYDHFADGKSMEGYYSRRWPVNIPVADSVNMSKAIDQANQVMQGDNVDYTREIVILERLLEFAQRTSKRSSSWDLYQLNDLLLRACNHRGDVGRALMYGEQAVKILNSQPRSVENYRALLETLNRMSVIETNRFNFRAASDMLNRQLLPKLINNLRAMEDDSGPVLDPILGKCCSSLGQNLAYLGQYKEALQALEQALGHFASDPVNCKITTAHVLHVTMAQNDQIVFEHYAPPYFNDPINISAFSDPEVLLTHRWQHCLQSPNPFALCIFVKSLNVFDYGIKEEILEQVLNYDYNKAFGSTAHHPWELVYRHMAEIAFKSGQRSTGDDFINKSLAVGAPSPELTLQILHLGTRMIAASYCQQDSELSHVCREVLNALQEICAAEESGTIYHPDCADSWFYDCVTDAESKIPVKNKVQRFIERFTFSYR